MATGAADGYARMSGRPAATLLHLGPGLGNGLANLHNARRAKVPETLWRDLEAGYTTSYGGVRVLPNPGPDVLEQIANALEVTIEDLTRHVGRITNRSKPVTDLNRKAGSGLPQKVARLGDRDRRLIESLVDQMLELE